MVELLSRLRRAPERLLHGRRRRRARATLAARPRPGTVLVVCNGNIFRSPFAAAVLRRRLAPLGVRVESGGFIGPGRAAPADAVAAAAGRGVDLTAHRSQLVTQGLVARADLVVVVERMQRRAICERFGRAPGDVVLLGDFDPGPIASREIEDPVEQGPEVCAAVYARIERCLGELASVLARAPSARTA